MRFFHLLLSFLLVQLSVAQQVTDVDFKRINAQLFFEEAGQVSGSIHVTFEILKDVDSVYLDAVDMAFEQVILKDDTGVSFPDVKVENQENKITLRHPFKAGARFAWSFNYKVAPKQAMYFVQDQIWTQGQGKYTSHWLPSIDDMNEKIEFDLSLTYDSAFEVVANGVLLKTTTDFPGTTTWHYAMDAPMSSYLVAVAIGHFSKKEQLSSSGVPLEFYFYPADSAKVEPTYRYSRELFDYLEKEIGVAYPWGIYRQVPVKDFLYSGMENTTLTLFSDAHVVDAIAFNDRNYVNVNAHELAHQWFGDLVTATSSQHHWLQEGFATYYALLAEREIFGDGHYYWQLYESALQLLEQEKAGESTALLDGKASSLTFYQKGCWALHMLREQVGDDVFRQAVKAFVQKYAYKNVETADFIKIIEDLSGQDLQNFSDAWLTGLILPEDEMVKSLKQSEFIREYLEVGCEKHPLKCQDYLVSNISDKAKIKILSESSYQITSEDYNNHLKVRQAIAEKLAVIPPDLKNPYESLLKDASYKTIEVALYHLWVNFPEERSKYLHLTRDIYGFSDYNVKLLWLVLHLNTLEYQPEQKQSVYDELKNYTDPKYGFDLRMNAFNYLKLIDGFDAASLRNLVQATNHHNWRFQKFAKQLLEQLNKNEKYHAIISAIQQS